MELINTVKLESTSNCLLSCQPNIAESFTKSSSETIIHDQVVKGEIYFAKFVAEHNLPFLAADHLTNLVKTMFPDSKIADLYSSARTKTTAITTHALAPKLRKSISYCLLSLFSIHYSL